VPDRKLREKEELEAASGESVASLRQAFAFSGAKDVLASSWVVTNICSERFLKEFLKSYDLGTPLGQAIRNAQVRMIDAAAPGEDDLSHPFFWAVWSVTTQRFAEPKGKAR